VFKISIFSGMQAINGQTHVYGIIGEPVSHSLSPLFQNHFFEKLQLNARYLPFAVSPKQLELALSGIHAAHVQGLNVTIPHKESILPFVQTNADAEIIGAVNTLKRTLEGWQGINTDWQGFSSVIEGLQADVSQAPVLLFGAGGTSRAILHALHHQSAKEVYLCNRSQDRAQQLISTLAAHYPAMTITMLDWQQTKVSPISQKCSLVINSTSIGLKASDIFPFELIGHSHAIDAVYKPNGHTAFGVAASEYIAIDGLPMLIAQGIASFSFWFEQELLQQSFDLPNKQASLQWVESQLKRKPLDLPGWRE